MGRKSQSGVSRRHRTVRGSKYKSVAGSTAGLVAIAAMIVCVTWIVVSGAVSDKILETTGRQAVGTSTGFYETERKGGRVTRPITGYRYIFHVQYSYVVDGKTYYAAGSTGYSADERPEDHGDTLTATVYYDPDNPGEGYVPDERQK